jgi:isocitrate lyase
MFELARGYQAQGMAAYSQLQEREFRCEQAEQYEGVKHQRFVGTGYFDDVQHVITSGTASTKALEGSTENKQFHEPVEALNSVM